MKNIKKFSFTIILALCLCLPLSLSASAEPSRPRVVDGAALLTNSESIELTEKLDRISLEYHLDVAVVTTYSLNGKSAVTYAMDFYEEAGYGQGDGFSGIMLLVAMEFSDYYILTSGDAMDIFSEGDLDSLEDAFLDSLSAGEYLEAFDAFAGECEYIIKYDGRLTPIWILISLIVGAVVAGLIIWNMLSKHKNVKAQKTANSYMRNDTFRLDRSRDIYLYSHVTRVLKPQNNSSSGSRSSSGRSYGGRGGKF